MKSWVKTIIFLASTGILITGLVLGIPYAKEYLNLTKSDSDISMHYSSNVTVNLPETYKPVDSGDDGGDSDDGDAVSCEETCGAKGYNWWTCFSGGRRYGGDYGDEGEWFACENSGDVYVSEGDAGCTTDDPYCCCYLSCKDACEALDYDDGWKYYEEYGCAEGTIEAIGDAGQCCCINESEGCSDSDGGISEFVFGIVTIGGNAYRDYCRSSGYELNEYYCKDGVKKSRTVSCGQVGSCDESEPRCTTSTTCLSECREIGYNWGSCAVELADGTLHPDADSPAFNDFCVLTNKCWCRNWDWV